MPTAVGRRGRRGGLRLSELKPGALGPSAYGGLPATYYASLFNLAREMISMKFKREGLGGFKPKNYHVTDASLIHFQPAELVEKALKETRGKTSTPVWRRIVEEAVMSEDYIKLNILTQGSAELSGLAAASMLANIFKRLKDEMNIDQNKLAKLEKMACKDCGGDPIKALAAEADRKEGEISESLSQIARQAVAEASGSVQEYREAKSEAEAASKMLAGRGGDSYTKEALSVLKFLEQPDEFRRRVRLLATAYRMLHHFQREVDSARLVPISKARHSGVVNGVKRMESEEELARVVPSELAQLASQDRVVRALASIKLVTKNMIVYKLLSAIKPVVFIDRSGSMAGGLGDGYEKIAVAAGLALALHRKLDADIYLFDTEVERVDPKAVVKTLLTIEADGGTNIEEVFRTIARIDRPEHRYIIITDAIDHVSSEMIRELKSMGIVDRTTIIVVPPAWSEAWLKHFKHIQANRVADFTKAVKSIAR